MSHNNGLRPAKLKTATVQFNAQPRTQSYRPSAIGYALNWYDGNQFSWLYVDRMRRDPQIRLGEAVLRAPMHQVKWRVYGRSDVGRYVHRTLVRFWRRGLGKAMNEMRYGHQPAEVTYRESDGQVQFDRLLDVHPLDARPLQYSRGARHGEIAGVRFNRVLGRNRGHVDLQPPNAAWFVHQQMYGQLYGQSRYEGAFLPWMEKRGKHGASDIRRIWFLRNAFNGGIIRYPEGNTEITDGQFMSNESIARQVIEKLETGGLLILPNARDATSGEYLWTYDPPKPNGNIDGMMDYYEGLDHEALRGMGIPPEMVDAATVGSGYSGRAIPAQMFFSSLDEWVSDLIETFDRQILNPCVRANYGNKAARQYEIEAESLAVMVARDPGDAGKSSGDDGSGGEGSEGKMPGNPLAASDAAAKGEPIRMSRDGLAAFLRGPSIPSRWDEPAPSATIDPRLSRAAKREAEERYPARMGAGEFDESKHPRADDGKFGHGGGDAGSGEFGGDDGGGDGRPSGPKPSPRDQYAVERKRYDAAKAEHDSSVTAWTQRADKAADVKGEAAEAVSTRGELASAIDAFDGDDAGTVAAIVDSMAGTVAKIVSDYEAVGTDPKRLGKLKAGADRVMASARKKLEAHGKLQGKFDALTTAFRQHQDAKPVEPDEPQMPTYDGMTNEEIEVADAEYDKAHGEWERAHDVWSKDDDKWQQQYERLEEKIDAMQPVLNDRAEAIKGIVEDWFVNTVDDHLESLNEWLDKDIEDTEPATFDMDEPDEPEEDDDNDDDDESDESARMARMARDGQQGVNDAESIPQHILAALWDAMLTELEEAGDDDKEALQERLDALQDLMDDPDELRTIFAGVRMSWVRYGTSRSGKPRWKDTESKRLRYQVSQPGSRETRKAEAAKAIEVAKKVSRYEDVTADHLRTLADNAADMSVEQIRTARAMLGVERGSRTGKRHGEMVAALRKWVEDELPKRQAASEQRARSEEETLTREPVEQRSVSKGLDKSASRPSQGDGGSSDGDSLPKNGQSLNVLSQNAPSDLPSISARLDSLLAKDGEIQQAFNDVEKSKTDAQFHLHIHSLANGKHGVFHNPTAGRTTDEHLVGQFDTKEQAEDAWREHYAKMIEPAKSKLKSLEKLRDDLSSLEDTLKSDPHFTGTDSLGREWVDGKLVAKGDEDAGTKKERKPKAPPKPKKDNPVSLLAAVRSMGGIDPEALKKNGYNINEDFKQFGLISALKKESYYGLDTMATALHSEGHIQIPDGVEGSDYLLQQLQGKAESLFSILNNSENRYAAAAEESYNRLIESGHDAASLEEVVRAAEEAGVRESDEEESWERSEELANEGLNTDFDPSEFGGGSEEESEGDSANADEPQRDLFGNALPKTFGSIKGTQQTAFDYSPDLKGPSPEFIDAAKDFAKESGGKYQLSADGKITIDGVPHSGEFVGDSWKFTPDKQPDTAAPSPADTIRDDAAADEPGKAITPEQAAARKWTKNDDGTYTSPGGVVWRKAAAGGEESPVNGKFFIGGSLMPIHGQSTTKIERGEGTGDVPMDDVGAGGEKDKEGRGKGKPKQKWQERTRDSMGDLVNVPDGHVAIEKILAGSPVKSKNLNDDALNYLGLTKQQAKDLAGIWEGDIISGSGVAYIPREVMPPTWKTKGHIPSDEWNIAEKFKQWKESKYSQKPASPTIK